MQLEASHVCQDIFIPCCERWPAMWGHFGLGAEVVAYLLLLCFFIYKEMCHNIYIMQNMSAEWLPFWRIQYWGDRSRAELWKLLKCYLSTLKPPFLDHHHFLIIKSLLTLLSTTTEWSRWIECSAPCVRPSVGASVCLTVLIGILRNLVRILRLIWASDNQKVDDLGQGHQGQKKGNIFLLIFTNHVKISKTKKSSP
jgi:hypothetical protein